MIAAVAAYVRVRRITYKTLFTHRVPHSGFSRRPLPCCRYAARPRALLRVSRVELALNFSTSFFAVWPTRKSASYARQIDPPCSES